MSQSQKLPNEQENYKSFFNTISDFLFVLDEKGAIIDVNDTVIKRLGYTKKELLGQSVLMVHPEERRQEAGEIVGQMLSGRAESCPVPIISKKGLQIPVETRITHGTWNGEPALFGVTKDVSQIKFSEEKFSKLFTLNPSACGLSDLETHQYIEVNKAFYNLLGFDQNEVIGKTPFELKIFSKETAQQILKKADKEGRVNNAEAELYTKTGEVKHVLLSSENIHVQNQKYRFTVVNDITERKQYEETIKKHNKLLTGLSEATDHILSNSFISAKNITDALKALGLATNVDRVYIFEQHPVTKEEPRGTVSQRYEWSRANVEPQIDNPKLQNMSWSDVAPRWYDNFIDKKYISGDVADFPKNERAGLEPQGIISILALPIEANNKLWGFIGFDSCREKRVWDVSEVELLHTIANSFAVTIERMRAEHTAQEKITEIEEINQIMTGRELKMIELKDEIERLKKEVERLQK